MFTLASLSDLSTGSHTNSPAVALSCAPAIFPIISPEIAL